MAWIAPVAGAAASIIGDLMSQSGQQDTNQMQMQIAQKEIDWQTDMSNTAMQRRFADLKAAGVNPMLAVNTPGAAMGSPVMPNIQNPSSAFSGLGGQISNAMQLAGLSAQVRDTNASAALKEAQTPSDDIIPVDADGHISADDVLNSPHGGVLGRANVAQALSTISQINATTDNIKSSTNVNNVVAALKGVDLSVAQQSAASVIQKAVNDAKLGTADVSIEQARAKILGGPYGAAIQAAESVLGGGFVGKVIGTAISNFAGGRTVEKSIIGPSGQYRGGSVVTTR